MAVAPAKKAAAGQEQVQDTQPDQQPAVKQPVVKPTTPKTSEKDLALIERKVFSRLRLARPDLNLSNFRPSPMAGVYKVDINGELAFVSEDGGFLIAGEMYQATRVIW